MKSLRRDAELPFPGLTHLTVNRWIPACQGNDGDQTGSRFPPFPRKPSMAADRPASREETRGHSRARVMCTRHSRASGNPSWCTRQITRRAGSKRFQNREHRGPGNANTRPVGLTCRECYARLSSLVPPENLLMSESFLVACVQNRAGADMSASIAQCERLVREAHRRRADLICLPEFLSCLDMRERRLEVGILPEDQHPAPVSAPSPPSSKSGSCSDRSRSTRGRDAPTTAPT